LRFNGNGPEKSTGIAHGRIVVGVVDNCLQSAIFLIGLFFDKKNPGRSRGEPADILLGVDDREISF